MKAGKLGNPGDVVPMEEEAPTPTWGAGHRSASAERKTYSGVSWLSLMATAVVCVACGSSAAVGGGSTEIGDDSAGTLTNTSSELGLQVSDEAPIEIELDEEGALDLSAFTFAVTNTLPTENTPAYERTSARTFQVASNVEWITIASGRSATLQPGQVARFTVRFDRGALLELGAGEHEGLIGIRALDADGVVIATARDSGGSRSDAIVRRVNARVGGSEFGSELDPRRVSDGLVALYDFEESGGTVVHDTSDFGSPLDLDILTPNAVVWQPGSLVVHGDAEVVSPDAAKKISEACKESGEVTIEAWITPEVAAQSGPARIVTLSDGSLMRNVTLGHGGSGSEPDTAYNVRLRTTASTQNGIPALVTSAGEVQSGMQHVVYTCDASGTAAIFVDGAVVATGGGGGNLSNWDVGYRFALGNEIGASRPWAGSLHLVAVFDRALTGAEVFENFNAGAGDNGPGSLVVNPSTDFVVSGFVGDWRDIGEQTKTYELHNPGEEPISWSVEATEEWATVVGDTTGVLAADERTEVVVGLDGPYISGLGGGVYLSDLLWKNETNGFGDLALEVKLTLTDPGEPGDLAIEVPQLNSSDGGEPASFRWRLQSSGGGPVRSGQYACGSYWVAPAKGDDGVRVVSLTGDANDLLSLDADPKAESRGLLNNKNGYGNYNADESLLNQLPMVFNPDAGSCISLVAAKQRNESEHPKGGTKATMGERADAYCVVTVLPQPPAGNSADHLRPNITGQSKDFLTWGDFDLTRLSSFGSFPPLDSTEFYRIQKRWSHSTEIFGFWHEKNGKWATYSEGARAFRAQILHDEYGSGMASAFNNNLLSLLTPHNSLEEKKPALAAMLAFGNDLWHVRYDHDPAYPRAWPSGAGQSSGKYVPVLLLAALLEDSSRADVLKAMVPSRFGNDRLLHGPQEIQQIRRGVTGVILWGDSHHEHASRVSKTSPREIDRRYWADLKLQGRFRGATIKKSKSVGKKTAADPYGYIDGPGNSPGSSYMVVSLGSVRALAAIMIIMPAIREIVNTDDPIEYADRVHRFGAWAFPDPIAPPTYVDHPESCSPYKLGEGCYEYDVKWGPNFSDLRFGIPSQDGLGRFDAAQYHGKVIEPSFEPPLARKYWDLIMDGYDGERFEENAVALGIAAKPEIVLVGDKAHFTHPHPLAVLRYTTDGTQPNGASPVYASPITVYGGAVVKCFAEIAGQADSAVREVVVP